MNLSDYGYSRTYADECSAWTSNHLGNVRKRCSLPPTKNVGEWIYLCNRHFRVIEREFEESLDSLNSVRVENLKQRLEQAHHDLAAARDGSSDQQLKVALSESDRKRKAQTVYFIRCQQYIKIGISRDPATRLHQIRRGGGSHFPRMLDVETAELIATEPGGLDRERELHKKFQKLRHTGEWFTESRALTNYINRLLTEEGGHHAR